MTVALVADAVGDMSQGMQPAQARQLRLQTILHNKACGAVAAAVLGVEASKASVRPHTCLLLCFLAYLNICKIVHSKLAFYSGASNKAVR